MAAMEDDNPLGNYYSKEPEEPRSVSNDNELSSYQIIELGTVPPEGKWTLPPLYRQGAGGRDLYYQIGFDGEYIVTLSSTVGGKIKTARNRVELNTRSDSLTKQAMVRARHLFTLAIRDNYRQKGSNLIRLKEPMLGHPFKKAASCRIPLTFPVGMEFKLDGVRGMFELENNGEVSCRSRGSIYYQQYDRICQAMKGFFEYLPSDTMLDAEIYKHGVALPDISGASRKYIKKKGKEGEENNDALAGQMIAHIFDARLPNDPYYEDRKEYLRKMFDLFLTDNDLKEEDLPFTLLPHQEGNSMDEIEDYYKLAIENGYEGIIIKRMAKGVNQKSVGKGKSGKVLDNLMKQALELAKYKGSKSHCHNFYKLKPVDDEEGIILDVLDCKGREEGCGRLELIDPRGNIFTIRPEGDFGERRNLLEMREELIGKLYTYKSIGLTKYGVPNHPTGVCVRDDMNTEEVVMERRREYAAKGICICDKLEDGGECVCSEIGGEAVMSKKNEYPDEPPQN
jgi:hypothetical protein